MATISIPFCVLADCQYFYICIDSIDARRNGCTVGLVFNEETLACDRPENVNGACRTWYNETFLETIGGPVPFRPPVGSADGVPLDQVPGRRVQVQRRRPPPPQAVPEAGLSVKISLLPQSNFPFGYLGQW